MPGVCPDRLYVGRGTTEPQGGLNALNGGETEYSLSTGTTLENQELFDGRNVIVQLAGITGTPEYPELKLAVRNGTRENLNFSVNSLVINGWEVGRLAGSL